MLKTHNYVFQRTPQRCALGSPRAFGARRR